MVTPDTADSSFGDDVEIWLPSSTESEETNRADQVSWCIYQTSIESTLIQCFSSLASVVISGSGLNSTWRL